MATARYYDGTVGESFEVTLHSGAGVLGIVHAPTGKEIVRWPLAEVELIGDPDTEPFLRLRRRGSVNSRLVIEDAGLRASVARLEPRLARLAATSSPVPLRLGAWGTALVVLFGLAWMLVNYMPDIVAPLVPFGVQVAIGDEVYEEFVGSATECRSPAGVAALKKIVTGLEKAADYGHPIRVTVVQQSVVNAFALPGGRVVIFSKLIDEAEGPQELGHVIQYHSMRALLRHYGIDFLLKIVTGGVSDSVTNVVSAAQLLLVLRHGRDAEREADTVGLKLLEKAGWRQDGLATFFGRMLKEPGGDAAKRAGIFSSHPPTEERIAATRRPSEGAMPINSEEWRALRTICR
jgi:predicted Zn-dependent protease